MTGIAYWFKVSGHLYDSAEIQLLKDFIDGKIQPGPAAISFTKSVDMKDEFHSPLYHHSTAIISLAVYSLDSAIQRKFVRLASAIRTIRKRSLNLDNKTLPSNILDEMDEIIGDWWESLWCNSRNPNCANEHLLWVSLNEFTARLTKANICDWTPNAATLCNSLLEDHKLGENPEKFNVVLSRITQTIRKDPTLFALALSAASQHMIHAALDLYTFCERSRTCFGRTYRWEDWKAVFQEAETIENAQAKKDALFAVVSMNTAERIYNSRQTSEERQMVTRAMLRQLKHSDLFHGQPQQKNVTTIGRKRDIDEAFPKFYESGTTVV